MYAELFKHLTDKTLFLTANQRLAIYLQTEQAHLQKENPQLALNEREILPWQTWLVRCWEQYSPSNAVTLLSLNQEFILWEGIIHDSPYGQSLLQYTATAEMTQQAWQLCHYWQIDFSNESFQQTEDTHAWQHWAYAFADLCDRNHWMDQSRLSHQIVRLIEHNRLNLPDKIFFIGFLELNPAQRELLQTLNKHGCPAELLHYPIPDSTINSIALTDTQTEIHTMAHWAYQCWKNNPHHKIGCIVPNLTEIRSEIYEIFCDVFSPMHFLPGENQSLPFNLAGGESLNNFPLIHIALQLLALDVITPFIAISELLRSPYLTIEAEKYRCAQLDVRLRDFGETEILLRKVLLEAKKIGCLHWATQLENYLKIQMKLPVYASPNDWVIFFTSILEAFNWSSNHVLDSAEYQLTQQWSQLLQEFITLYPINITLDKQTALQQLSQLAARSLFQPQTPDVNIHIIDPLESIDMLFDHAWIMGLHDNAWPALPKPNPFIPLSLQRKFQLPHADHERELHFYRLLTKHLYTRAPEVIFSYPEQDNEQTLRKSPLIHFVPTIILDELKLLPHPTYAEIIFANQQLEFFEDWQAPELKTEKVFGGHAILQEQASCPFRAFARFRLHAQELTIPAHGLNARDRGNLLHIILEACWNQINTHENLLNYSEQELQELIAKIIDNSLLKHSQNKSLTFKQRFTELEKNRLQKLISRWLEIEKKRMPFKIRAIEHHQTTEFAGLTFNLRLDRIDQLSDNRYLIIDYKTGIVNKNDLLSERPNELQLLLYAVTSHLPINSIAFAQIRSDQMKFSGISSDSIGVEGVIAIEKIKELPNEWSIVLQQWRTTLTQLATQFRLGDAKPDPKDSKKTCRHCDFSILCRVTDAISNG